MDPLDPVLRPKFAERGVELISIRSQKRTRIAVLYKLNQAYFTVVVSLDQAIPHAQRDARLAELAVAELDRQLAKRPTPA